MKLQQKIESLEKALTEEKQACKYKNLLGCRTKSLCFGTMSCRI